MTKSNHGQALSTATLQLLRPLVRILLRNNVSHRTFSELAKRVYVEVAKAEFAIHGKKQTVSRIAILTGLTRKEVQGLLALSANSKTIVDEEYHRASRVITGWIRDPRYGDGEGHPRPLPMEGRRASFGALVKSYSGDIPVRALLDELLRVGAVKQLKDGRICLVSRGYIPQKGSAEKLHVLGADTADLIATIDYNVYLKPTKPRFQRKVMYDNVPVEVAKEFRTLVAAEGQARKECSYDTRPSYGDERREGLHNHTGRPPDIQRERLDLQEIERGACLGREDNMKMTHLRLAVLGAAIMVWPVTIMAGDFKTPVAPEEVLKMPNPIPPTSEVVKDVPSVYESKCSKCHGDKGDGKGSATKGLDVKPRNYRDKNVMEKIPDGQLFWIIANGSDPEATEMSGYKKKLSEEQMWALVHYIRRFTQ